MLRGLCVVPKANNSMAYTRQTKQSTWTSPAVACVTMRQCGCEYVPNAFSIAILTTIFGRCYLFSLSVAYGFWMYAKTIVVSIFVPMMRPTVERTHHPVPLYWKWHATYVFSHSCCSTDRNDFRLSNIYPIDLLDNAQTHVCWEHEQMNEIEAMPSERSYAFTFWNFPNSIFAAVTF